MLIKVIKAFIVILFMLLSLYGNTQFLGGEFDGSSSAILANNSCKSISITPFTGGSSSGFASIRYEDTCNSVAITPFTGGISDGFANIRLGDTCNAMAITPFSGGISDGFAYSQTTNEVCFSISVTPFSGGIADGFAYYSYLVVDPETCDPIDPLPIDLLRFDAIKEEDRVRTEWVTLSERDNDFFTIEKSLNGFTWESIGNVKGAGNSSYEIEYALYDMDPVIGLQYYRLKQTDFDGKFEYSEIRSVLFEEEFTYSISVYPNPTNGLVNMSVSGKDLEKTNLTIYSSLGKVIYTIENFSGNKQTFDLSDYQRGVYILKVVNSKESKVFKIIKN